MNVEVVHLPRVEELFVRVQVLHPVEGAVVDRLPRTAGKALALARCCRSVRPRVGELLVVYAMVFDGNEWIASRPIGRWRGVHCRWRGVHCRWRAIHRTRWERIAPASEQPRGGAGGEDRRALSRGCSGAGAPERKGTRSC